VPVLLDVAVFGRHYHEAHYGVIRLMATIPVRPPRANFSAAHALLGRLYLEHRAFLRRLLLGQLISPRDVDDLVQDVFVTA